MKLKEKKQFVDEFKEEILSCPAVVLANYEGVDANTSNILRKELKNAGCMLKVVKNRLALRAFEGADKEKYSGMACHLKGPVAVILGGEDPTAGLKVFKEFGKENESMFFKAGIIGDNVFESEKLVRLAELPSRDVLIAQVVNVFNSPLQGFHSALSGIIKKLLYALNDLKDKMPEKEKEAAGGEDEKKKEPADEASEEVKESSSAAAEKDDGAEEATSEKAEKLKEDMDKGEEEKGGEKEKQGKPAGEQKQKNGSKAGNDDKEEEPADAGSEESGPASEKKEE